jgi:transcriptional regulator with XRE-family HTH domain
MDKIDHDNIIAFRLRQARTDKGISQKNLGILAGIDEFSASPRINQYERGKHIPDLSILRNLGKILNVPASYFSTDSDQLAELIILFHRSNQQNKEKIFDLLKSL